MQEPVLNNGTLSAMALAAALSVAAGFFLFQRHIDGQPLLPYEPRRRVPWGPLVLAIPLFFIGINLLPVLAGGDAPPEQEANPQEFFYGGLVTSLLMLAFVVIAMGWLLAERKADRRDLGLPADKQQFWSDVRSGCVACMAALLPIYMINLFLVITLESKEHHPLIEHLLEDHSPLLLLVGFLSAVVAAPIFEEFAFRVLLQGWLERLEDERLGYAATLRTPTAVLDGQAVAEGATSVDEPEALPVNSPRPSCGWISALSHGWTPIILSAVAFGLAHLGHGVAPIPLVFLGLVFGYLYQRTHRIAPSIAAHALFNAYSLLLLWLQLPQG